MNIHTRVAGNEALLHWVQEREAIRIRKEGSGAPPYTDDPILRDYRFCNVRREDDRVTRWIADNIRRPFADHPHLWFMLCMGRWVNWPDALAELIASEAGWPSAPDFTLAAFGQVLQARMDAKEKTFGGAYTIDAPKTKGGSKPAYLAEQVLPPLWRDRSMFTRHFSERPTLRETHYLITNGYRHWGHFMTYQTVVDMRFTSLLSGAADIRTWCAAGPGTIRGLNRMAGRRVDYKLDQAQALQEMRALFARIENETDVAIDLSDVPNICCEVDKYLRALNGEGAPKARYVPGRGY